MILRNAAVRHGRALAPPRSRSTLRLLSTEVNTDNTDNSSSDASVQAWPTGQSSPSLPDILRAASSKKRKQKTVQEFIMSLGSNSAQEHSGASWTKPHQVGSRGQEVTPAQQFADFQRIQKNTRSLGSHVERRYMPTELIRNPPGPEDVSLELLMASQAHMGHNTSLWNPANSRYIYGVRQGIHIISLETIAAHLRRAARVVEEVSYRGGIILFVGTRKGQMEIVTKAAELAGACHLFTKWTPGAITNRDVILKTQATKVVNHLDTELDGFDLYKGMARPLLPDLVVCLNPLENYTMLYECGLKNIPTIGVIDTNVDPSWVTYTIPANDDSLRAMAVVAGVLGRAGQKGKERRLQDASRGKVSWNTSPELEKHMKKEVRAAVIKRKEVMGRIQSDVQGFTEEEQKLLRIRNNEVDLEVSEDEMVNILGETALKDAKEAAVEEAAVEEAVVEEAVVEEAAVEEAAVEEAVVEEAVVEEAVVEQAVVEQAVVEEAAVEDAVVEEAVVEEAAVEEAVVEEAVVEQAVVEEAAVEEAVVEASDVSFSKTSVETLGKGPADIEAQLQRVQEQTRQIELAVGSKQE